MSSRLDLLLIAMAMLFVAQLQWRFLPERGFQVVLLLAVVVYLWQLVAGYRADPEGGPPTPPALRWATVIVLVLFVLYVALRFMWGAAG